MQSGGILCLDLAQRTGWAYGLPGHRPLSGVWRLPSAVSLGAMGAALIDRLQDTIAGMQPRLMVAEAALPPGAHKGINAGRQQLALAFAVDLVGHWLDVEVREEHVQAVRKAVLGRGVFGKGEAKAVVMEWARSNGFEPTDDNEGDALLLWHHASNVAGQRT